MFKDLKLKLEKEKPDFIIHCGDIVHSKTVMSPGLVQLISEFLTMLSDIAPTYLILGNHDINLRNPDREDAISPIVSLHERITEYPRIKLLKGYQKYIWIMTLLYMHFAEQMKRTGRENK
jgi:DNA repair exonuclease SbcCD nuclease subunit